jgi:sarcosine oxidase, subunit beta
MKSYDVIIIGAGSVGTPLAFKLAEKKMKVLVLDKRASVGQGQNKAAIGGIRATHSDPAKIQTCLRSLAIFSTWHEHYGYDMGWIKGGYTFPAYTESIEMTLKTLLEVQKSFGLNIDWYDAGKLLEIAPGINPENLRGGTFSPDDGHLCPLLAAEGFYRQARKEGAQFRFSEEVTAISIDRGATKIITTSKGTYGTEKLVIAAGAEAAEAGKLMGLEIPVTPDSHEAGITEPVKRFFSPLVVDLRERPASKNFYFYQNAEGQIVFCVTPSPLLVGSDRNSTSIFLPQVAKRLIEAMPRLAPVKIRRTWRGLYPMTPDGVPIVDSVKEIDGLFLSVGMCGQGLMLGPGLAVNLASIIVNGKPEIDADIFKAFSLCREFSCVELLK